jgi:DNA polymerase
MYDNPMEALASIIRNFIREPDARMIDLDLANIEGRVAGWLAGDEVLLDEFRAGLDVYKVMASSIYGVDINEVDADQRMTGKVAVLSCGYGTGWRKFQDMALAYGHELDDATCRLTVYKYRKARRPIVQAWQDFGDAAIAALRNPGESYFAGEHVRFKYGRIGGFPALIMTLPSGRSLIYPEPQLISKEITADILVEADDGAIIMEERQFSATSINFYGQQQGKTVWGRIETHGSKLFENACQAVAGDFLVHGLLDARAAGFRVTMVVHDQALCPWQYTGADKEFLRLMTNIPPWAPGFPLKAEVKVVECYSK